MIEEACYCRSQLKRIMAQHALIKCIYTHQQCFWRCGVHVQWCQDKFLKHRLDALFLLRSRHGTREIGALLGHIAPEFPQLWALHQHTEEAAREETAGLACRVLIIT